MIDHTVLMEALGINYVEAASLVVDDMALHHHQPHTAAHLAAPEAEDDRTITPERKVKSYPAYTDKMTPLAPGSSICSEAELLRWLAGLLCFIEAQSTVLGPLLREFCVNPGMLDPEYQVLHTKIPELHDRQLAHAISVSIPSLMQERITTKLGIAALGLDILRQVTAVHYGATTGPLL